MVQHRGLRGLVISLAAAAAACGGSNLSVPGGGFTATPTLTETPLGTATPTSSPAPTSVAPAAVSGLIVLQHDFAANVPEHLDAPPSGWAPAADTAAFDRAFGGADWSLDAAEQRGVTTADGRFAITGLAPGPYQLHVTRTIAGNLVPVTIPFTVGDDGSAAVVAEVGLGLVRTSVTYTTAGSRVREIRGPYGNRVIIRDGRVNVLSDGTRTLTDTDGDGRFDNGVCADQPSACGPQGCALAGNRICQCTSSCPFCDDCGPGVCVPKGVPSVYGCGANDTCTLPGDRCVCVASCPDCQDCVRKVCVPACVPVAITALTITAPAQIVAGRDAQAAAVAQLSDGTSVDVTALVSWSSTDQGFASVDSWGVIHGRTVGSTTLIASLGDLQSAPFLLGVVAQPTLQHILVQNLSCACGPIPLAGPNAGVTPPCIYNAPVRSDLLPVPSCAQVVLIGSTLQFTAVGEYADGSYTDLTSAVQWTVLPAAAGQVRAGQFTATGAGTAALSASLAGVTSDPTEIRVVSQPTLVSLSIYAANWAYPAVSGGPVASGVAQPCFDCGAALTVLRGDQLTFQATAHYDTGEWRDVSAAVTWRSSDSGVATVDASGALSAVQAGEAAIDAVLDGVASNPVNVRVVNDATLQSIFITQEGTDRVVAKADQRFFHATGSYDVGISRDITTEADWRSSDENIGGFDTPGVFTGRAAGTVQVWAELDGQKSPPLSLEVFETSELAYCDPDHINRSVWADDFNRVTLESDCADYTQPGVATLRYTVTETQPHGGIFDPCLDLYVYQGNTPVRTIREEGCGDPFLPAAAPGRNDAAVKYQLRAFWDLKDDSGSPVADGTYTIYGRFYLYYDPVVQIDVTVGAGGGAPGTPTPTPAPPPGVAVLLGTAGGAPGERVGVDVTLQTAGAPVAAVQNDMVFDPRLPIDQTDGGSPACKVNLAINKPQTAFAFLPPGCRPGVDCSGVRAIVVALDNVDPIPDGAVLYSCSFSIPPDLPAGSYPLRCAAAVASDPDGKALGSRCLDGAVRVGTGSASPTPTPQVYCTPPACPPGQVVSCLADCPGGCGSVCVGPTPVPAPAPADGACFIGSSACEGSYFPTAQERCCQLYKFSAMPAAVSWCPGDQLDAPNSQCTACALTPCDGL